jgi:replication factor C small subunit
MKTSNFIWYEKHRPGTINEMILPPAYREKFEQYIEEQNIPHLLLHGPCGSGKTTMATILMDNIKCQRVVLNASGEDRGIATIKGKVKQFAASQPLTKKHLKIVFLDEADFLTPDAQKALRNTMETYSSTCRFILTGNYIDKILPEIKSRCTMYEFSQYPIKKLIKNLYIILEAEKVKAKKEDVEMLITRFYPDIRSVLNNLQAGSVNGEFDPDLITSTSIDISDIKENILKGNVRSLRKSIAGLTEFTFLYRYLFDEFIFEIPDDKRSDIAELIAEFMYRDTTIADREINITMCFLMIMRELECKICFNS